jgi:hypothetical protein
VIFPRYGIMAPWEQVYLTIDFESFQGYPHYFDIKWLKNSPRFRGLPITHIVEFLKYISEIEFEGEDVLVKLFILSLSSFLQYWIKGCCEDKGISSFIDLISRFLEFVKPQFQTYEDSLQNLAISLEDEGFTIEIVEDLRDVYHTQYQEPSDIEGDIYEEGCQPLEEEQDFSHDSIECSKDLTKEVSYEDEALVSAPPSDEALQDPISPAQDKENEVNHFPFPVFYDTLFYDSKGEEVKEPLEELGPSFSDEREKMIKEMSLGDDVLDALPFDEVIQAFDTPAQQEVNTVSYFPFQDFDDALFYDLESEEVLEDPLDALNPSCYDKYSDMVDNIDEFIHVGRRKWDVIGSDEDPIYDMEGYLRMFPLQQSYDVLNNFDVWKQDDDIITEVFQAPKDDPVQISPDDFRSYLEDFDEYPFEHLDLFYEEYYQPSLCSNFDKGEDVGFLKQDTCDKVVQLPLIALPRYVTKDAVGEHVSCFKFSLGKKISLEFKGRLNALRSLLSQSFSFPLRSCQFPSKFLLIPSQTPGSDDVQGSQPSDSLSHPLSP